MNQANATTDEQRLSQLTDRPVGRLLWEYSLPAVIGMLVMALYNIVDRMFVGHIVGPDAIAGLTVTFPVMNINTAIGVIVGAGSGARVSILLGNRDLSGAQNVFGNAMTLVVINAAIFISLFTLFMDPMLRAFGASDTTLPYAHDYMICLVPGLFLINVTFSFNNVMRASGFPRKAMVTMLIGAIMNVILTPLFIYVLDMGIKGAAIATDISMLVSSIFVMSHFARKESVIRYRHGIYRLRRHIVAGIIAIGAAPCIVNVASCLINMIINRSLLTYGGDNAVAAAGIFTTYSSMIISVVLGICQGMQPIIGYNYGAGRIDRLKRAFLLATAATTTICLLGWIVGMCFPRLVAMAFTKDGVLIDVTANALSLSMLCFFMVGFQIVATTFFQSIGKASKSIFLGLTRQVIFLIPLLFILQHFYGLKGIWMAFPSGDLCATIVTTAMIIIQFRQLASAPRLQPEI